MADHSDKPNLNLETTCAHLGGTAAAHVSPLVLASVMDFPSIESSLGPMEGAGYVYRRNGNPNGDEMAAAVAKLEGAERGLATSSGMSAISAALFGLLESGDVLVVPDDCYGGVRSLVKSELSRFGIETRVVDMRDEAALDEALVGARVAFFETITNPLLRTPDVGRALEMARSRGALSIVDNTFATPLRDRPIEMGADLVVHSATKFLSGHHDVLAGVVVGRRDLVLRASSCAIRVGMQASPLDCWMAVRGMRTLALRVPKAWESATEVAARIASEVGVVHSADRCCLISFDVGDFDRANATVAALEMITLSPSLGGVATTISHPATSSHRGLSQAERAAAGIGEGLLRVSIGVEAADDVARDLLNAIRQTG